jgi:hypothetical protein
MSLRSCGLHLLPLLLPPPQARRVAIGELDAGLFQHALDRREIVPGRVAAALLEIDDDVFGKPRPRQRVVARMSADCMSFPN